MSTGPEYPPYDALVPSATARKAEDIGVATASMSADRLFALAVLAGAFIAFGAVFSTVVTAGGATAPGVNSLLGGLAFSLGLILVVVGGAELFTGNTLVFMALANRRIRLQASCATGASSMSATWSGRSRSRPSWSAPGASRAATARSACGP